MSFELSRSRGRHQSTFSTNVPVWAVDRFGPIHRTSAEFLAAEDLSGRILAGLPTERVIALVCGIDGKPVSSLRGLFAWLMCNIRHLAEGYVGRDPYGVVV